MIEMRSFVFWGYLVLKMKILLGARGVLGGRRMRLVGVWPCSWLVAARSQSRSVPRVSEGWPDPLRWVVQSSLRKV